MTGEKDIRDFASAQITRRLGRLAFEINRGRKKLDEDAVHDLRVSIRRFTQSLRVFSSLLPHSEAKRIRKELREIMDLAGAVRDLDIARQLIQESKIRLAPATLTALTAKRKDAKRDLGDALHHFSRRDHTSHWRDLLHLRSS